MSDFREMVIEMTKLQVANAKALAIHHKFQEGMSENTIYPIERYDSDAEFFDRPIDWQEQQAKDIEELEKSNE